MPTAEPGNTGALTERIADEVRRSGPIPFSRFMDLALYEPRLGYYATSSCRIGTKGDFFTASDVGSGFGDCLARQLSEMDRLLDHPAPFWYVEYGAGRGWLARDVLDGLAESDPELRERTACLLADTSPAMREEASRRVPEAIVVPPEDVGARGVGCVVAVELFDALPVHRVRRRDGQLREVFVDVDPGGRLVEAEGEPLRSTADLARRYAAAPEEGDEAEVCPQAIVLLDALASAVRSGFLLVVDYGYRAKELFGPAHRRGTLLAYRRHTTSEDYLGRVGEQDLTAHVNFSVLEDRASEIGLAVLGLTTQDRFLIANGILDRFAEQDPARWAAPARVRGRMQAMQLLHPEGMGRTFKVLLASKGLSPPPRLVGLEDPFARSAGAVQGPRPPAPS